MIYSLGMLTRRQSAPDRNDPSPADLVLVAIVNTPRDLEIARSLGWYRIPVASAPRTLHVDWLAMYLPGAFGSLRWSVRYLAEVRGYELCTRRELLFDEADHPRSEHPYFKLQLGRVRELHPPIESRKWHRFTFLYTTGERLLRANDLTELTMPSGQAKRQLLRERGAWIPAA